MRISVLQCYQWPWLHFQDHRGHSWNFKFNLLMRWRGIAYHHRGLGIVLTLMHASAGFLPGHFDLIQGHQKVLCQKSMVNLRVYVTKFYYAKRKYLVMPDGYVECTPHCCYKTRSPWPFTCVLQAKSCFSLIWLFGKDKWRFIKLHNCKLSSRSFHPVKYQ